MGRKPKPNHLHLVQGTGRADRHSLENAPQPPCEILQPPLHLAPGTRAVWERLAPVMARMGILTTADSMALERLCCCYADIRRLATILEMEGATYETKSVSGVPMTRPRPEASQMADADRRLKNYLVEFGLTPAARTRVNVAPGGKPDPLDHYFA
jgi:P27 family predicted phage terminase small subunit